MGVSYEVKLHVGESSEDHQGSKKSSVHMSIRKVWVNNYGSNKPNGMYNTLINFQNKYAYLFFRANMLAQMKNNVHPLRKLKKDSFALAEN